MTEPDRDDAGLLPELAVPAGSDPSLDEAERAARWLALNHRAQLSVHEAGDASYSLYADHPLVRAELAVLAAAEAAAHAELEVAALVGDGHLVLAVRPRPGAPADLPRPLAQD
jgi:hypothetical protein